MCENYFIENSYSGYIFQVLDQLQSIDTMISIVQKSRETKMIACEF